MNYDTKSSKTIDPYEYDYDYDNDDNDNKNNNNHPFVIYMVKLGDKIENALTAYTEFIDKVAKVIGCILLVLFALSLWIIGYVLVPLMGIIVVLDLTGIIDHHELFNWINNINNINNNT